MIERALQAQPHVPLKTDMLQLAQGVEKSIEDSRAKNTNIALESRFKVFRQWTTAHGFVSLPAESYVVALYAQFLDEEGKALSTIAAYVSAIATMHRDSNLPNPCESHGVKLVLEGKRRQHAPRRQHQALALSDADKQTILMNLQRPRRGRGGRMETQDYANGRALVDAALLLTMTQAGLRRSETASLRWSDIEDYGDGTGRLFIRSSKTDQIGDGEVVAVKSDCMRSLAAIRPNAPEGESLVFNLSGAQINRRLKAMCAAAGLDSEAISGHTPRVSLARAMSEKGAPTHIIQRQGRWHSPSMVASYTRRATAAETLRWL